MTCRSLASTPVTGREKVIASSCRPGPLKLSGRPERVTPTSARRVICTLSLCVSVPSFTVRVKESTRSGSPVARLGAVKLGCTAVASLSVMSAGPVQR